MRLIGFGDGVAASDHLLFVVCMKTLEHWNDVIIDLLLQFYELKFLIGAYLSYH